MQSIKNIIKLVMRFLFFKLRFAGSTINIDPSSYVSMRARIYVRGAGSIRIGRNCRIEEFCKIEAIDGSITIHDDCFLRSYAQVIGNGTIELGKGFMMHSFAIVRSFANPITVGYSCSLNPFSILFDGGGLSIGNHVSIAAHTVVIPANHRFQDKDTLIQQQGIDQIGVTIKDDVWIATNCSILDGVTIGTGCVVGAGSVVTRSVSDYTVVVGVPAKKLSERKAKKKDG